MRKSDIFEKYAEIAEKKGLVSKGESAIDKLNKNPRMDSLSISDIEILYGVKPDAPKDMEYDDNIMEDAHPEKAIVGPAHDKMNGLVENNIERQKILINIINKPVNGQLMGKKYAEKELLHSLIRTANDLDTLDNDELRILADTCIDQLSKEAFGLDDLKDIGVGAGGGAAVGAVGLLLSALVPAAAGAAAVPILPIIGTAALAGALLTYLTRSAPAVENVEVNSKDALSQIEDLVKKFPDNQLLKALTFNINKLSQTSSVYKANIDKILAGSGNLQSKEVTESANAFKTAALEFYKLYDGFKLENAQGHFNNSGSFAKIKSLFSWVVDSDAEDVLDSLRSLNEAVINAMKSIQASSEDAKKSVEQAKEQAASQPQAQTAPSNSSTAPAAKPSLDIGDELGQLGEMYKNIKFD